MFARSEAIGVRSSWPASAIRCRWACDRALERVERRVEAARQPRQLVATLDLQAPRQVEVAR